MDEWLEGMSATEFMLRSPSPTRLHPPSSGRSTAHLQANIAAVLKGPLPNAMHQRRTPPRRGPRGIAV